MIATLARALVAFAWLACAGPAAAQQLAPIPPLAGPVVDATMTLSGPTRAALDAQARALAQRKGSQLQVLVVPTTQPEDIAQYATRAYEQYRLGREDVDDGLLLVVAKDDRRARIEVGYGLEGAIPDAIAARVIQEYLVPRFRAGDFDGGVTEATAKLVALVDGEPLPPPMAQSPAGGIGGGEALAFAAFAAFIAAQVLRAIFGWLPAIIRVPLIGAACAMLAWVISHAVVVTLFALVMGLMVGAVTRRVGRFARDARYGGWGGGGWGGGGWGGGGWGGSGGGLGGGGWSGGGGMSGGGGASGSW